MKVIKERAWKWVGRASQERQHEVGANKVHSFRPLAIAHASFGGQGRPARFDQHVDTPLRLEVGSGGSEPGCLLKIRTQGNDLEGESRYVCRNHGSSNDRRNRPFFILADTSSFVSDLPGHYVCREPAVRLAGPSVAGTAYDGRKNEVRGKDARYIMYPFFIQASSPCLFDVVVFSSAVWAVAVISPWLFSILRCSL